MKIIYENSEGGVSVVTPAPGVSAASLVSTVVPAGSAYSIVEDSEVPTDRLFRAAWRKDGDTIDVDLTAAKEVAHEVRRGKRAEEFAPHDKVIVTGKQS